MVSTSRGGSRVVDAELACNGETQASERRAKVAAAPSTVGISLRPGGGRGKGGGGKRGETGRRGNGEGGGGASCPRD